jgi:hypothetical protein
MKELFLRSASSLSTFLPNVSWSCNWQSSVVFRQPRDRKSKMTLLASMNFDGFPHVPACLSPCVQNPTVELILSQLNSVHALTPSSIQIRINIFPSSTSSISWSFQPKVSINQSLSHFSMLFFFHTKRYTYGFVRFNILCFQIEYSKIKAPEVNDINKSHLVCFQSHKKSSVQCSPFLFCLMSIRPLDALTTVSTPLCSSVH